MTDKDRCLETND
ncbi:similar to zinc finger, ZZ domain containing 3, isoform CRA_a [Rattus norvegicus]|uniref:Similar to zinc finger, ZZ domain containing 3, isoform CRA_a n=1 Tax=Rattus norvegicus TaxID=10116 RepID=A6HWL8_RAT|nr:similar to zinc finger, ZZ domain containing 3, isoform CRA_a [Rattus norvegicus]